MQLRTSRYRHTKPITASITGAGGQVRQVRIPKNHVVHVDSSLADRVTFNADEARRYEFPQPDNSKYVFTGDPARYVNNTLIHSCAPAGEIYRPNAVNPYARLLESKLAIMIKNAVTSGRITELTNA